MAQKTIQYEIKAPGIGFHVTKYGTLNLKFTSKNILQLRDILATAAQKLTEQAVVLIEQEREEEVRMMRPPPSSDQKHEERVAKARTMPVNIPSNSIARRIIAQRIQPENMAGMATARAKENSAAVGDAAASEVSKTIVTGGFEGIDDGILGPPPASIK